MNRESLIVCFQDTVNLSYSKELSMATESAQNTNKVYRERFVSGKKKFHKNAEIIVEENTSFAAAKKYSCFGKTAVLNFANPHISGGGVRNGAMAQEECLCRSSNLFVCLQATHVFSNFYEYHQNLQEKRYFFSDRLIYTKGVIVFKTDDPVPQLMQKNDWFPVDVITCAAPYIAKMQSVNQAELKEVFKSRIKNIFEAAVENEVEVIILGAFGCGAFKNPAEIVAKAFDEVIQENKYEKLFEKIVFAIKSTVKRDSIQVCPNLSAFEREFCKK